jgi:hypothetical protein
MPVRARREGCPGGEIDGDGQNEPVVIVGVLAIEIEGPAGRA